MKGNMKTINPKRFIKIISPSASIFNTHLGVVVSGNWITNGNFMIMTSLEPKVSRKRIREEKEVLADKLVKETAEKRKRYECAVIMNHFEHFSGKNFMVKLESESNLAWVNAKYLSYILSGLSTVKNFEIEISDTEFDPIIFTIDGNIVALVMGIHRREEV